MWFRNRYKGMRHKPRVKSERFLFSFEKNGELCRNIWGQREYSLMLIKWEKLSNVCSFRVFGLLYLEIKLLFSSTTGRTCLTGESYDLFQRKVRKILPWFDDLLQERRVGKSQTQWCLLLSFLKVIHFKIFSMPSCYILEWNVLNHTNIYLYILIFSCRKYGNSVQIKAE